MAVVSDVIWARTLSNKILPVFSVKIEPPPKKKFPKMTLGISKRGNLILVIGYIGSGRA